VDGGALVGAGEGKITLVRIITPQFPEAGTGVPSYAARGTVAETNATGRATMELVRGTKVEVLVECGRTGRRIIFTVPDQASFYLPDALDEDN
jgi:hypothetical protein